MSETTPIESLMTTPVVTVSPDATASHAAATLLEEEIGSLLVTDDDELVGVVTATDFLSDVVAGETDPDAPVTDYATTDVETVGVDTPIASAAGRMAAADVQHLPVVDGGVVGLVSATDLTAYLAHDSVDAVE
ncbi:CBS domain-containing protein [Halobaculum sp. MBLA0143]|uniref:CBS domain-containing protein n=1 Tax=Halobaculum sp. MBLA0143 TaxID=3079933 RepID=UPI003526C297